MTRFAFSRMGKKTAASLFSGAVRTHRTTPQAPRHRRTRRWFCSGDRHGQAVGIRRAPPLRDVTRRYLGVARPNSSKTDPKTGHQRPRGRSGLPRNNSRGTIAGAGIGFQGSSSLHSGPAFRVTVSASQLFRAQAPGGVWARPARGQPSGSRRMCRVSTIIDRRRQYATAARPMPA